MSIKVMSNVWANSKAKGSQLLLLLSIADHSHDDGSGAYPSLHYLARKVRMTKRNVQHLISKLVEMGELEVTQHGGPNRTNLYRVKSFHHGDTDNTERVIGLSPKSSINHQTTITKEPVKKLNAWERLVNVMDIFQIFSDNDLAELRVRFPQLDIEWEANKCVTWWGESGRKMKRPRTAFLNWLEKANKPKVNGVKDTDPFEEGGEYDGMQRARISGRR